MNKADKRIVIEEVGGSTHTALEVRDELEKASNILLGLRFVVTDVYAVYGELASMARQAESVRAQAQEIEKTLRGRMNEMRAGRWNA